MHLVDADGSTIERFNAGGDILELHRLMAHIETKAHVLADGRLQAALLRGSPEPLEKDARFRGRFQDAERLRLDRQPDQFAGLLEELVEPGSAVDQAQAADGQKIVAPCKPFEAQRQRRNASLAIRREQRRQDLGALLGVLQRWAGSSRAGRRFPSPAGCGNRRTGRH